MSHEESEMTKLSLAIILCTVHLVIQPKHDAKIEINKWIAFIQRELGESAALQDPTIREILRLIGHGASRLITKTSSSRFTPLSPLQLWVLAQAMSPSKQYNTRTKELEFVTTSALKAGLLTGAQGLQSSIIFTEITLDTQGRVLGSFWQTVVLE